MSSKEVKIEDLQNTIKTYLNEYKEHIDEVVEKSVKKRMKEAKMEVKSLSPTLTGQYRSGWAIKSIKGANTFTQKIWNKKKYRLTHLLEFGHWVKRNGQIVGYARPIPHIRNTEIKYLGLAISDIEEGARK